MESVQNPPGSGWAEEEIAQAASLCVLLSISPSVGNEGSTEDFHYGNPSGHERPLARDAPVRSGGGVRSGAARQRSSALVVLPPQRAVGKAVGSITANPSKRVKEKVAFLPKGYWGTDGMGSAGYFGSPVGVNEAESPRSIAHQGQEDSGQAPLELW